MPGNVFDVFVVGSADPSAAGETRLAAALSAKYGIPLATVAKAIAVKNLRAGHEIDQQQAQALVKELQSIGGVTVIRPTTSAASAPSARAPAPGEATAEGGTGTGSVGVPRQAGPTPVRGRAAPAPSPARPPALARTPDSLGKGFRTSALSEAAAGPPLAPFAPSTLATLAPDSKAIDRPPPGEKTPVVAARRMQPPPKDLMPPSGLVLDVASAPRLEVARPDPYSDEEPPGARLQQSMSPASLREMNAGGKSGVAVDQDPRNHNLVRCVQHGLYYDKSKASGCRKCLGAARAYATKIEHRTGRFADLRGRPARRAFLGLIVALLIGFLPAAYYCFGPGAAEGRRLRVEQEVLSRQPGTLANLHAFADLDAQVGAAHGRASRNTAAIWAAVAGVALLGWYRVT
jgi:hypothetical protein